jgi:hypothetical protein
MFQQNPDVLYALVENLDPNPNAPARDARPPPIPPRPAARAGGVIGNEVYPTTMAGARGKRRPDQRRR